MTTTALRNRSIGSSFRDVRIAEACAAFPGATGLSVRIAAPRVARRQLSGRSPCTISRQTAQKAGIRRKGVGSATPRFRRKSRQPPTAAADFPLSWPRRFPMGSGLGLDDGIVLDDGRISPATLRSAVSISSNRWRPPHRAGFSGIGLWHTDLEHVMAGPSLRRDEKHPRRKRGPAPGLEFLTDWFTDGARKRESEQPAQAPAGSFRGAGRLPREGR